MIMYRELSTTLSASHGIEMGAPTCDTAGATLSVGRVKTWKLTFLESKQQSKQTRSGIHFAESPGRTV